MRSGSGIVGAALLAAMAQACAQPSDDFSRVGKTQLHLTLPDGRVVHTVDWEISGGDLSEPMLGVIDVEDEGDEVSAYIGGIPVAFGYVISLTADADADTCQGSAAFDIPAEGETTLVDVHLHCGGGDGDYTGDIAVNVDFDFDSCPATTMVVAPLRVNVGNTIDLTATSAAGDSSYEWVASAGSIDAPAAASATFTCTDEGPADVELTIRTGDDCARTRTVEVTCAAEGEDPDPIDPDPTVTEESAPQPRVVMTYDGGIVVLDANSLETLADFPLPGFNRVNSVGDERHVAVSTAGGWLLVDAGAWTEPHGDHDHYYSTEPSMSEVIVAASQPAHVVVHDGYTVLFDDGTGQVTAVEVDGWTAAVENGQVEVVREYTSDMAHHGVAVLTEDGRLLVTLSDRSGAMVLDENDDVIVTSSDCPGVHGETAFTAADGNEYMMVGCQDGVLLFDASGTVRKFSSPDAYGRIGNQFSSEGSDIVLGDYRNDPDAGLAVSFIALIDVVGDTLDVVDPFEGAGAVTTWRGLRRGDDGEVLVLGNDGALRVIDPFTGAVQRSIDVIAPWEVPEAWQTAHPALDVAGGKAYVTEPSTGTLYAVDYVTGEVVGSAAVGVEMNEIVGVEG